MFSLQTSAHATRTALLNGPTVDVLVPFPSPLDTAAAAHTVPAVPRQLLFALAREGALQLRASDSFLANRIPVDAFAVEQFAAARCESPVEGVTSDPRSSEPLPRTSSATPTSTTRSSWSHGASTARSSSPYGSGSTPTPRSSWSHSTSPTPYNASETAVAAVAPSSKAPPVRRSITFPADARTSPAAAEYMLQYLRRACRETVIPPLFARGAPWRLGVQVLGAARALGVKEVENMAVAWVRERLEELREGLKSFGGDGEGEGEGETKQAAAAAAAAGLTVEDVKIVIATLGEADRLVLEVAETVRMEEEAKGGVTEAAAYLRGYYPGVWEGGNGRGGAGNRASWGSKRSSGSWGGGSKRNSGSWGGGGGSKRNSGSWGVGANGGGGGDRRSWGSNDGGSVGGGGGVGGSDAADNGAGAVRGQSIAIGIGRKMLFRRSRVVREPETVVEEEEGREERGA